MRKLLLMMVAVMTASLTFAQKIQERDVPNLVMAAFQQEYPKAKETKWEMESPNYEAEFEMEEVEYSVLIDASGNLLDTEAEISIDALPSNVKEYVSKNYSGLKIKEAGRITDANGTVSYEAEVKGKDLLFDSNGKFVKEEIE